MALAVTHILVTIVALDLLRHYLFGKHKFPRYLIVVGGIAGLGPDIDIVFTWFYNLFSATPVDLHGAFTHSFFWMVLFLGFGITAQYFKKKMLAGIAYVLAASWLSHLLLDCLYGGYKTFFWPISVVTGFCPQWGISPYAAEIDAIILVLWLVHEELHHYIKDYF